MEIAYRVKNNKEYNDVRISVVTDGGKTVSVSTGLSIKEEHWDYKRSIPKSVKSFTNYTIIRIALAKVKSAVYSRYCDELGMNIEINKDWLHRTVMTVFKRPVDELEKYSQ
ncbi:hypothetical protein [Spongiimicrobium salis]|uniref:hypothetical protein n=1 Tax=Spongiimicrobium salis TaxID=1667022 RepID=UPI00374D738D